MEQLMTLAPSEYTGEAGTCVCGRVVLSRGPFKPETHTHNSQAGTQSGKAKGKKGKKGDGAPRDTTKTEIHILGGTTVDEVLFIDGWADGANQLAQAMERGRVYRIVDAKKIDDSPRYSTSRLPYFLRFVPPIGVNTKIVEYTESPWAELPLHHPFAELKSLKNVGDSLRISVIGVVSTQPGLVQRDTKFGYADVCNAVLKQGNHSIRCGFWRGHGQHLAENPVGSTLALHQVNVYFKNNGWEVTATEATQIEDCPQELREALLGSTPLDGSGTALTTAITIDYNIVKTTPATLSGLASVVQPHNARDLRGVFEVHGAAVLGISPVLSDNRFSMRACKKCKAQVRDEFKECQSCADDAGCEAR
jgi:hypothetical protein